jgi:serine/threonine protein kinase
MSLVLDPEDASVNGAGDLGTLGTYRLLERVGVGALGEVFRSRDTRHGRTVAIKRVPAALSADATRLSALRDACATLAPHSHPGVAMLYECDQDDGQWFLAQEFVAGQSLTQLLAGQPLNPRRAVEIAIEIADALTALHAAGIAHGDLRSETVFLTQKGHVKLLDAGLAAFTSGGALRRTAAGRLGALGAETLPVVRALAPEEAMGEGGDRRADLHGLGIVFYQMLTGHSLFEQRSADDTLLAVLRTAPASLASRYPKSGRDLDVIITRALAKPLAKRYPSAAELAAALRAIKATMDAELTEAPSPPSLVKEPRRAWPWWLAALAMLSAAGGWWLLGR